jgi:glutaminyl-peptide cyclotransferase
MSTIAAVNQISIYTKSNTIPTAFKVINSYPHDSNAYTQGLMWNNDSSILYESTGHYGQSTLRKLDLTQGTYNVVTNKRLDSQFFAEGIVLWTDETEKYLKRDPETGKARDIVVQLTWKEGTLFVYDAATLELLAQQPFSTYLNEGWGITHDTRHLIVSDGSSYLFFWDPVTMQEVKRVQVRDLNSNQPIERLNELEYLHGYVFANIWFDSRIAIIHPESGKVLQYLECAFLKPKNPSAEVLNGIAYTMKKADNTWSNSVWGGSLWITGKYWDTLYQVEFTKTVDAPSRRRK